MNNSDKNFDRIEDYLFGQLNETDKKTFHNELSESEKLSSDLDLHKMEHRAMELLVRQDLKANLDSWKEERVGTGQLGAKMVSLSARRRLLQYAAAACALIVAGFFVWILVGKEDSDMALASRYFDETSITNRSSDQDLPAKLVPALRELQKKDYDQAISLLANITDSNFINSVKLLQGEAYFLNKDYEHAITSFQWVIQQGAPILDVHEAEWRLTLTYLAMGDKGQAFKSLLDRISSDKEHSHFPQASALKKVLY
jgi:tetratricopeptide (TPR) repeat protein